MKKSNFVLGALALIMASALVFTGCKPQPEPEPEVLTHTVTFDADGGTGIEAVTVNDGETVAKPENPTKEGYSFGTWMNGEVEYDFDEPVTTDLTLKATWTEITCKVTFNTDGGSEVAAITVKYGEKVTLPETDPTKDGVNFAGWYTDAEFTTPYTDAAIKADTVLYAKWSTDPVYTITLNYNYEGSKDASVKAVKESEYKVTAPTGEREDYKLAGWYTDKECTTAVDFTAAFSADTTIYAKWTRVYSLKDETADLYKVYLASEGSTATEVKKFTNGAVAAFLETTNNGTEVVLNVNEDGSAASSATYEKLTVKFDYEVCEWSDSTVTPKFRLVGDGFDDAYFDGAVAGGKAEKTVNLTGDVTQIKLGFNAFEWAGAETDRIKIIVREVTLVKPQVIDLGDETEGSYSVELDTASSTTKQKKTYTNGAVAAILDASGTKVVINKTAAGSAYEKVKITFDYKVMTGETSPKLKIAANDDAFAADYPWFGATEMEGTKTVIYNLVESKTLNKITFSFNNYQYAGASTDSFKLIIRSVELIERIGEVTPIVVDLSTLTSYGYDATEGGLVWTGTTTNYKELWNFTITDLATLTSAYNAVEIITDVYGSDGSKLDIGGAGYDATTWANRCMSVSYFLDAENKESKGNDNYNIGVTGQYVALKEGATNVRVSSKTVDLSKVVIKKITFLHN